MSREDWLIGQDRASAAAERIYSAAAELIARHGFDAFTIEALARKVHCSPATIYRHAGGKAVIRDAVTLRLASRILGTVREAIEGLTGSERIVTASAVALQYIRAEPLAQVMGRAIHDPDANQWITRSPLIAGLAQEMIGSATADPVAAQWLIRVVLALWCWPPIDPDIEQQMLQRFLGPPFASLQGSGQGAT
jgi:AcrR family transcriptional regulator